MHKWFERVFSERGLLGARHPAELANVATHGVGLVVSVAAVCFLLKQTQKPQDFWSCLVFGMTMIAAYAASTCLHAAVMVSARHRVHYWLEVLDHSTIYSFIAGTFTPFYLRIEGALGDWLIGSGWAMALAGIAYKFIFGLKHHRVSLVSYLLMGWFPVMALQPILHSSSTATVALLVAGGLAYTAGVPFFLLAVKRPRLHAIWHLFVMLGSAFHYAAVWITMA